MLFLLLLYSLNLLLLTSEVLKLSLLTTSFLVLANVFNFVAIISIIGVQNI